MLNSRLLRTGWISSGPVMELIHGIGGGRLTDEYQDCPYCGWQFIPEKVHRDEQVLPYCSHGCKYAVRFADPSQQNHHGAIHVSSERIPEGMLAVLPELNDNEGGQAPVARVMALEVIRELLDMSLVDREIMLRYLRGMSSSQIATELTTLKTRLTYSKQAVHQRLTKLAQRRWVKDLFA